MGKRVSALWVTFFFVILTLIGLITCVDYGLSLDGASEQVILQENLKEYAALFWGDGSEQVQGYDALGINRITESIEMDHGQAAYYLAAPILQLQDSNPYLANIMWHMVTWLWFMVGVLSVYAIGRSLGMSKLIACSAALLLYLSPRFFAEGHYNNKDVVLLALSLWTVAAGIRMLQKPNVRRALMFGLAGALAANIRIIGFFVFGVMGITAVVQLAARHEWNRKTWESAVAAIVSFIVVYVLITPAFMLNPSGFITHVLQNATAFSRWTGVVIFKGTVYDPTGGFPLPHSYLPTMIGLTVPISVLVLGAIGGIYAVHRCAAGDDRRPVLIALIVLWFVPFLYAVLARPLMYNGWRHFYFLYAPMIIMAGFGLLFLRKLLRNSRIGRIAGILALVLIFVYQGIGIAVHHPYQYAYYNELAQDEQTAFELDYWELSTLNALQALAASSNRNPTLPLTVGGGDPMSLFSLNQTVPVLPNGIRDDFSIAETENPPYVFSNTTYAQIYSAKPGNGYRELFTLQSYGNVICTVYERLY